MKGREPLPFLGDVMLLHVIEQMALPSVLTVGEADKPFQRMVSITETGRDVRARKTDFLSLGPAERWVGGIRIDPTRAAWRIDDADQTALVRHHGAK